jgi:hypothetical protein
MTKKIIKIHQKTPSNGLYKPHRKEGGSRNRKSNSFKKS